MYVRYLKTTKERNTHLVVAVSGHIHCPEWPAGSPGHWGTGTLRCLGPSGRSRQYCAREDKSDLTQPTWTCV